MLSCKFVVAPDAIDDDVIDDDVIDDDVIEVFAIRPVCRAYNGIVPGNRTRWNGRPVELKDVDRICKFQ